MLCVEVASDGAVYVVDPQPIDTAGCGHVLVSGESVASSPFALTTEQGAEIGAAILGLWAVAYGIRVVIRALNIDQKGDSYG